MQYRIFTEAPRTVSAALELFRIEATAALYSSDHRQIDLTALEKRQTTEPWATRKSLTMTILSILKYPDPRLRRKARPVETVDADIRTLVDDMAETMYAAPGIGLAAVQVDVARRVIVIDISEDRSSLLVLINPELIETTGAQHIEEGCLSVPDIYAPVERAETIQVRALDRDGKTFEMKATGLLAVCIQHEIDHLEGKVFVDYLSRLKQSRIRRRLEKDSRRSPQTASA